MKKGFGYFFAVAALVMAVAACPASAAGCGYLAGSAVESVKAPKGEVKTVVFQTDITCHKCVAKINDNIAFEKGVKDLKVDVKAKTITIKYDSSKTSVEKLAAAINKLGYSAEVVK